MDLDGYLIMDPEDRLNCSFCLSEDEAREIVGDFSVAPPKLRVHRIADGQCFDVTVDFIEDEDEPSDAYDRAASRADNLYQFAREQF
jgi:hypothetical protein